MYAASTAARRSRASRAPLRRRSRAVRAAARNPSTSIVTCVRLEPERVPVGGDEVVGLEALVGVEDRAHRAEEHREPVRERSRALLRPERLHQELARRRTPSTGDEDLEEVACLAGLPGGERHRPRRRGAPGSARATGRRSRAPRRARRGARRWSDSRAHPSCAAPRRPERRPRCRPASSASSRRARASAAGFRRSRQMAAASSSRSSVPGRLRRGEDAQLERLGERGAVAANTGGGRRLRRALGGGTRSPRASATHPAASSACTRFIPGGHASARSTSRVAASGSSATTTRARPASDGTSACRSPDASPCASASSNAPRASAHSPRER